jgi:hypothetical protein
LDVFEEVIGKQCLTETQLLCNKKKLLVIPYDKVGTNLQLIETINKYNSSPMTNRIQKNTYSISININ